MFDSTQYSYTRNAFTDKKGYSHEATTVTKYGLVKTGDDLQYAGGAGGIKSAGAVTQVSMKYEGAWDKTNTQQGIQEAYNLFKAVPTSENDADNKRLYYNGKSYSERKPVIILVTDGDPTLCTFNYTDPQGGPTYGQGMSEGIEGYYTILSANYFKNMTSILYNSQAAFYTIGVGITTAYQKAVLDPSSDGTTYDRINALPSATATSDETDDDVTFTAKHLYNLLEHSGGDGYWGDTYLRNVKPQDASDTVYYLDYYLSLGSVGITNPVVRGMPNPYVTTDSSGNITARDYDYCDGSWFDEFSMDSMKETFEEILDKVQLVNNYSFLLKDGTNLVMTDPIGEGFTVKGNPVLRIYGTNYAPDSSLTVTTDTYTEYHWSGTVTRPKSDSKAEEGYTVSLTGITARVTTDSKGKQTVTFTVPSESVPALYPDLYNNFYYEELPIRLIYRVGLSDDAISSIKDTSSAVNKIYYTNDYSGIGKGLATVTFTPDSSNPYYKPGGDGDGNTVAKDENTTQTSSYVFTEDVSAKADSSGDYTVTQTLGNNGYFEVSRERNVSTAYEFPETGGVGTKWFTIGGLAIITAGCLIYVIYRRKIIKTIRGGEG
jgi:LPXTG-motif cell wall-anchored protein